MRTPFSLKKRKKAQKNIIQFFKILQQLENKIFKKKKNKGVEQAREQDAQNL